MSLENAAKLAKALSQDEALRDSFSGADFEATASQAGYSCTSQEFAVAVKGFVAETDLAGNASKFASSGVVSSAVSSVV